MNVALEVQEREEDGPSKRLREQGNRIYEDVQIYESPPKFNGWNLKIMLFQMDFPFSRDLFSGSMLNFRGVAACFLFKTAD